MLRRRDFATSDGNGTVSRISQVMRRGLLELHDRSSIASSENEICNLVSTFESLTSVEATFEPIYSSASRVEAVRGSTSLS